MSEIIAITQCINSIDPTTRRRFQVILLAMLCITGRITQLGLSRWAEAGGSYRTLQRFFNTEINWNDWQWELVKHWLLVKDETYLIVGDEVVVTKAGKQTHGVDRFFSSMYNKVVPGLSFMCFSLVGTESRTSFPIITKQLIKEETSNQSPEAKKEAKKGKKKKKRGRSKGSKNKTRADVVLSPFLTFVQAMLSELLLLISGVNVRYVVLDGAFGTNYALQMVKRVNDKLDLISKLQRNSALYFPYTGLQKKRGRPRKYGNKVDYQNLPLEYRKDHATEDGVLTEIFQMPLLHKRFPHPLNGVIIVKTKLKTGARAQVILFSSDLELSFEKIIDYYRLRFQIEFNFRDAKQVWGLEDFMAVKEITVTNSANLAFFMVNLSQILIQQFRDKHNCPDFSVNDLKAHFTGLKYALEIIKLLPEKPDDFLIQQIFDQIATLGSVNTA